MQNAMYEEGKKKKVFAHYEMTKTNVQKYHAASKKRNLSPNKNTFSLGS